MYHFLLSAILLAIPFLALSFFQDKRKGFLSVLFLIFTFLTAIFFITQFFGAFSFWIVIFLIAVADIIFLYFYLRSGQKLYFNFKKPDWVLVFVLFISFVTLWQVHYNYTGKINLATDQTVSYHEVKGMKYVYPYFSDEWYAVSLIKSSINTNGLPIKNPDNTIFHNLEIFFHSFSAGMMLIFGLDPLTQYVAFSLVMNVLIIVLAYLFLRINKISPLSAGIASLFILYITCGANFPGLWHFIAANMGVILCLLGFCFISLGSMGFAFLSLILLLLFYPPLTIFYAAAFICFIYPKFPKDRLSLIKMLQWGLVLVLLIIPLLFFVLLASPLSRIGVAMLSKFHYLSFSGFNIPQYAFYNIIPWPAVILSLFGLPYIYKNKKWFLAPLLMGALFWLLYSFSAYRIIIEYERVAFLVSVLLCLVAGFGICEIERYLRGYNKIIKYFEIFALLLFLLFVPMYTKANAWHRLVLKNIYTGDIFYPKSPANNYLVQSDIKAFDGLKGKRFLSIPWKGTVVGVATDNYPMVTKEGTISLGREVDAYAFISSSCTDKLLIAKENKLDYVYMQEFECAGFEKVSESGERFILYKVKQNGF